MNQSNNEKQSGLSRLKKALLAGGVLAVGLLITFMLVRSGPEPKRQKRRELAIGVKTEPVYATNTQALVEGMGTVIPSRVITLLPEVTGKIVWKNPNLEPGALLTNGATAARIDQRDYIDALAGKRASLAEARLAIAIEKSRKTIAEEEWQLLGEDKLPRQTNALDLVLREPHLDSAMKRVEAAEHAVKQASRQVERTTLRIPFNAVVREESVDIGQLVGPQMPVATLVGSDIYWAKISLPAKDLKWFELPSDKGGPGAWVDIVHDLGDGSFLRRRGRVIRIFPGLDMNGHMAQALVRIPEPRGREGDLPLLLGAYVSAAVEGRKLSGIFLLPERHVHEGDRVWVVDSESRLDIRKVNIMRYQKGKVIIDEGLENGDRVVVSRIPTPIQGMKLKTGKQAESRTAMSRREKLSKSRQ